MLSFRRRFQYVQFFLFCLTFLLMAALAVSAQDISLPAGQSHSQVLQLTPRPGKPVHLKLKARVQFANPAGFSSPLVVTLNGSVLKAPQLVNKPAEFRMSNGSDLTWCFGQTWRVPYSPDFSSKVDWAPIPEKRWGNLANSEAYRFEFDVTGLIRSGANELNLRHEGPPGYELLVREVTLGEAKVSSVAPSHQVSNQGADQLYCSYASAAPAYQVRLGPKGFAVTVGSHNFQVMSNSDSGLDGLSALSAGQSRTVQMTGDRTYRIRRTVTPMGPRIRVVDEVENLTGDLIHVPILNHLRFGSQMPKARYLAGRRLEQSEQENPANPSVVAEFGDLAVAMVEEDDILRVHSQNFVNANEMGFRDRRLGVGPHGIHRLEWSLYVVGGDYWDVVNQVRRDWGSNETLQGPMAIDPALKQPQRLPSARYLVTGGTMQGNEVFEGPERCKMPWWLEKLKNWTAQVQPKTQSLVYLHWQICSEPDVFQKYPSSRLLGPNGEQRMYPFEVPRALCITTNRNTYGRALLEAAPKMLRDTGSGGFFLDEINYSVYPYAYGNDGGWDGCSVEPTSGQPKPLASVTLLCQSWKAELLSRIRKDGKFLIGNGAPHTRTIAQMKFPTVNETISYSTLNDAHFSTPWGLGNHDLTNDPGSWAEMTRRMLDYGCLFTPYQLGDKLPNCGFLPLMYPITIQELRPGVVLGQQRIITNRSGLFGWPDNAAADVKVFDKMGLPDNATKATEVRRGEKRLYQLRLPADSFAILIRR